MLSTIKRCYRYGRRFLKAMVGRDIWYISDNAIRRERVGDDICPWWVAPSLLPQDSVIYSFGLGDNVSFEFSLCENYGMAVHGFDPTPAAQEWVRSRPRPACFSLHEFGIADHDGCGLFYAPKNPGHISHTLIAPGHSPRGSFSAPVFRLSTIMAKLGHRRLDLLKMDIEGAEYAVVRDILQSRLDVGQLLIEFHHRFSATGVKETKGTVAALRASGYKLFYVSDNGEEYGFVRGS